MIDRPGDDPSNEWDADRYDGDHSFVYEYGADVVELLEPRRGERILDLGCGTGHLTDTLRERGADIVGLDSSEEMVTRAREAYPECQFVCADAGSFSATEPFDAVFSNAALHWIPEQRQDSVLETVADALRPGGRFVAECGGRGNVEAIVDAVRTEMSTRGYEVDDPWYFPSIGEYTPRLESHGLEVRYATMFDRPTELDGGEDGLASWLRMFGDGLFEPLSTDERAAVIAAVEDRLREDQFEGGSWTAEYRRLRFVAVDDDGAARGGVEGSGRSERS